MGSENRRKQIRPRKTPSSAWKQGQSGNPGGRPKVAAEIRDLARDHGPEAIQRLVTLMRSKNESVAVRAAEALLDRGYGRPMQGLELIDKEATRTVKQIKVVFVNPGERNSSSQEERYLAHERQVQTQSGHELSSNKSRPLLGALP